jgi:hypothetical protein
VHLKELLMSEYGNKSDIGRLGCVELITAFKVKSKINNVGDKFKSFLIKIKTIALPEH